MSRKAMYWGALALVLSAALLSVRAVATNPPAAGDDPFYDDGAVKPAAPRRGARPLPPAKAKEASTAVPIEISKPSKGAPLHGGRRAIMKVLAKEASLEFSSIPLKDAFHLIQERFHIPVVMDSTALAQSGIDASTPITCNLSGIPLQSALEIILDQLRLKWAIHHDVLMITTPEEAESDEFMYTKIYDVTELVSPQPETSLRDNPLTTPDALQLDSTTRLLQAPPIALGQSAGSFAGDGSRFDFQAAENIIKNTIAPKSWPDSGAASVMTEIPPRYLAISQTEEIHHEIEQLLSQYRALQRATPTLHVELHWLWLNAAHRDALFAADDKGLGENATPAVDPKRLAQLVREVPNFHAHANFLNGRYSSLAAGDRRALIVGGIPVLDDGVAYAPVLSMPNVGITASIRATVSSKRGSATLDVRSTITRWTPSRPPAILGSKWPAGKSVNIDAAQPAVHASATAPPAAAPAAGATAGVASANPATSEARSDNQATSRVSIYSHGAGSASCPIDLPVMPTQEFATTLRVPLGKPVIVGSVTFAPAGDSGVGEAKEKPVEVYLIATTRVVKP